MLCEKCNMREATVRYTEVRNGTRTDHNLCAACAQEMERGHFATRVFEIDYPIGKLLSDLFGIELGAGNKAEEIEGSKVICPTCHTAYSDFIKDSRFGCTDCYRVFDLLMEENIKKIQGSSLHKGKHPNNVSYEPKKAEEVSVTEEMAEEKKETISPAEEIEILRARLSEALEEEAYEKAAMYRDRIRDLKEAMHAEG